MPSETFVNPDRWERIRQLFEEALGRPRDERTAFLLAVCGSDHDLRAHVTQMLGHYESPGDFLETPAAPVQGAAFGSDSRLQSTIGPGTRVGPYEVAALIGAGGMGEVYRARDTRLGREVAIKVLAPHIAGDGQSRARFEREARAVAALNHPHICTLHDVGHQDGIDFLVMEYVVGETLAARLAKGPLPVAVARRYAVQIASALDRAHRAGIVHRDLKPANVMLIKEGVKLLDFGLAKAPLRAASTESDPTYSLTAPGMILGTLHYMAPEQLEGKPTDARTDIFAFGAVLFEMLTGRKAFAGNSQASVIAAILQNAPPRLATLVPQAPLLLDHVVKRCLAKDPDDRWQSARDLVHELESIDDVVLPSTAVVPAKVNPRRRALPWLAAILTGVIVAVSTRALIQVPPRPVTRFLATLPDMPSFSGFTGSENIAISPDGTRIVYRGNTGGRSHLYVRRVDQLTGTSLFSEGEFTNPVVSPDGAWVVFRGPDLTWKKVPIVGGPAITIFAARSAVAGRGASWDRDGTIVVSEGNVLWRVPAGGGEPVALTSLDTKRGEVAHVWPEVLPGGKAVLFTAARGTGFENHDIAVVDVTTGERRILVSGGSRPRYARSGHLVYGVNGTLMAAPFDPDRLQLLGNAVPVVQDVLTNASTGAVEFAVSADGSLVYVTGQRLEVKRSLVWSDRNGREETLRAPLRNYMSPRISPDGSKVALNLREEETDIWIWDFNRATLTRLSFDPGLDRFPVWSPDGRRIAYSSQYGGSLRGNLVWQATDGSGTVTRLADGGGAQVFPSSFSPDGSRIFVYGDDARTDQDNDDIGVVQLQGGQRVIPLLQTKFSEQNPEVSPDGRWLAYNSNESGRHEVYVRPFPDVESGRWQVSTAGGSEPTWARNGRELFFRNGMAVMSAPVKTEPRFVSGNPTIVFQGDYATPPGGRTYDVSPDGRRFLMIKEATQDTPQAHIIVVQNWTEELKRLVPVD